MPITHDQLISRADALATSSDEVELRESTRISYYSAFHQAREVAGFLPEPIFNKDYKPRSHERIIKTFAQIDRKGKFAHVARECAAIAQALLKAGSRRNMADYDLHLTLTKGLARTQNSAVKGVRAELKRVAAKLQQKATSA